MLYCQCVLHHLEIRFELFLKFWLVSLRRDERLT